MANNSYEAQDFIMNTNVEQKIYGDNAGEIYYAAVEELNRLENMMSFYRDTSEVSLLNRRVGQEVVTLSNEMMLILAQAKHYSSLSKNAFNIMISPLIQLWRKAGRENELPSNEDLERALALCDSDNLFLDTDNHTAFLKKKG